MNNNDLKRLSRRELVDIIYQLKKNEQEMQEKIAALKGELEEQRIRISNCGSIADAAVSITDIFATAQTTADLYLREISEMREKTEKECAEQRETTEKECAQKIAETEQKVKQILADSEKKIVALVGLYQREHTQQMQSNFTVSEPKETVKPQQMENTFSMSEPEEEEEQWQPLGRNFSVAEPEEEEQWQPLQDNFSMAEPVDPMDQLLQEQPFMPEPEEPIEQLPVQEDISAPEEKEIPAWFEGLFDDR